MCSLKENLMFKGSIVAIVTPFSAKGGSASGGKNSAIDEKTLANLVEFHVKNGTSAIVPCGTTGESPTLSTAEHERVIEICITAAKKRVPIIAGTGSNSTAEAVSLTEHAEKAGANAALIVCPYYNKPSQKGIYLHFKAIAESVDIPIIIYNIPGRTGRNIEPETIAKLAKDFKNIVGVKEASGSLEQMQTLKQLCPKTFALLSGDDALTLPVLRLGGVGVISVAANIIPRDVADLVKAFESGNTAKAEQLHNKMLPLVNALFIDTNPIPVKIAMGVLKMCSPQLRLPLCEMSDENLAKLKTALKNYGLLKK